MFGYELPFRVNKAERSKDYSADVLDRNGETVAEFPICNSDEDGIENANARAALFVEAAHKKAGIA